MYLFVVDALVYFPDKPEHEELPVFTRHVWEAFLQRILLVASDMDSGGGKNVVFVVFTHDV